MAKFIDAAATVVEFNKYFREDSEILIFVSPYLKVTEQFEKDLKFRDEKNKKTTIVYGKEKLKPDVDKFFKGLKNLELIFIENLHAKCYISDNNIIVTSLNFYEFSMTNNIEMGVLIDKIEDAELYGETFREVKYIIDREGNRNNTGYCIRTGEKIPFDIKKPFSAKAFKEWNIYKNEDYAENYCHFSGEPSKGQTSFKNPILKKNWKAAKEKFKF